MKTEIKNQQEFDILIRQGVKDFSGYVYLDTSLYCSNNKLTVLPDLPKCEMLYCSQNQLTALPDIHNCTTLYCYNNNLTELPYLPMCTYLYCSYNQLTALPELPKCAILDCFNNQLTVLPTLPKCTYLYCHNNQLTENYIISPTSSRSVYYDKYNDKILTGCFCGTIEEFLQKGKEEGKGWCEGFVKTLNKI